MRYSVNGSLVAADEAAVAVSDRGFALGDAVTVTLRAYGGDPFAWGAYADRLAAVCDQYGLDTGLDGETLRSRVVETLRANGLDDARVRLTVVRDGTGDDVAALTPDLDAETTVVVAVAPLPRGGHEGSPVWDGPATLQTVKTRRAPPESIPASGDTHNRLDAVRARLELRRSAPDAPADEAMMLDSAGHVAEGAASSICFVAGDALRTPAVAGPVTPRVTRELVLELARDEGIPVAEGTYDPSDVREADEVFLVNPTWELRPVETVDGIDVGAGPVTSLLSRLFAERVEAHY